MKTLIMPQGTHKGSCGEVVSHGTPGDVSSNGLHLRDLLEVTPLLSPPAVAVGEELGHVQAHP